MLGEGREERKKREKEREEWERLKVKEEKEVVEEKEISRKEGKIEEEALKKKAAMMGEAEVEGISTVAWKMSRYQCDNQWERWRSKKKEGEEGIGQERERSRM